MGTTTAINWCHHTFNPWRGCSRVSEGCNNCYAERWAKRNPAVFGTWGADGERVIASEAYWKMPYRWNRAAEKAGERRRVFCGSMMDFAELRPELVEPRRRVYEIVRQTSWLDWLFLTKRAENLRHVWAWGGVPNNAWLGVTVENQAAADERIPILCQIPAAVRFLSIEPMLAEVDLTDWLYLCVKCDGQSLRGCSCRGGWVNQGIDWIIVGGESGPGCRSCNLDWIRLVVCRASNVPVWAKQLGGHPNKRERLEDLPEDLRIRELPARQEVGDSKTGDD